MQVKLCRTQERPANGRGESRRVAGKGERKHCGVATSMESICLSRLPAQAVKNKFRQRKCAENVPRNTKGDKNGQVK